MLLVKKVCSKAAVCGLVFVSLAMVQNAQAMSHAESIATRQSAFERIESQTERVADQVSKSQVDWQALQVASEQLLEDSLLLSAAFPVGSQQGSKAKESVWKKPAKFQQLLTDMQQGYQQVVDGVQSQSVESVEAGLDAANSTCRSCHRSYRSRW
ncbi:cytochrome c [Vibrio wakamikoensis]|uniref:Cytochrome c n=1 Tax=Vibrio chaetopteri TaxID=3016528 RepID=A0AAU8BRT8_9VIBR